MKKVLFMLGFTLAVAVANAQFGIKAGLNLANWGGADVETEGKKSLLGPHFGVFYNAGIGENFSIQPELYFSQQGAKYEVLGIKARIVTNYLNLASLVRYNSPSGFYIGVGPQLGFLMSAKAKSDGDEEDIKDDFKSIDLAAALALGYELENGLGFFGRYNHGFTSVADDDSKAFNRVFQFGITYSFGKAATKE